MSFKGFDNGFAIGYTDFEVVGAESQLAHDVYGRGNELGISERG